MAPQKKHSYKRDAILEFLQSTDTHPTAEQIYAHLKPAIPGLSLATVYRNLAAFRAEGTIASLGVVGGHEHYDVRVSPHAHFACVQCGQVTDLLDIPLPQLPADYGQAERTHLLYIGVCKCCAGNKS